MNFKQQVVRGSAYLSLRMAGGAIIGLAGISLLTRLIGPANYGTFAAAHAILSYLVGLSEYGIGVYLIRLEKEKTEAFNQGFTLLLLLSLGGVILGTAAIPLLRYIYGPSQIGIAMLVLLLGLPIVHVIKVPMAQLEHRLDYKRVALIEFTGNIAYYLVALPVAYKTRGVAAPLAGWWAQQLVQFVQAYACGYRPRLVWRPALIKEMISFGTGYSASQWAIAARELVNPLLVGQVAGATGVGYVALAIRVVQQLGLIKTATARISIAAFARLRGNVERFSRAISEGMFLQIIASGPLLCAFALIAPVAIPLVFGEKWMPVLAIYPWLACAALISSTFLLHSSTLVVLGQNYKQARCDVVRLIILALAVIGLVPRVGLMGYGLAELASTLVYCWMLHGAIKTNNLELHYSPAMVWLAAFAIPLLAGNYYTWAILLVPLAWRPTRDALGAAFILLRKTAIP